MKFTTLLSVTVLSASLVLGLAIPANAQNPATHTATLVALAQGRRERHPEIRKAMKALERARNDLRHADRDFGGHRVKAMDLIDHALAECRAALVADRH